MRLSRYILLTPIVIVYLIGLSARKLLKLPIKILKAISLPEISLPQSKPLGLLSFAYTWFKLKSFGKVAPTVKLSLALLIIAFLEVALITGQSIFSQIPEAKALVEREVEASTKIYDRNGILLYKIYKDKNRTVVRLSDIPNHARLATLAAEDAEFYEHSGFSVRGILRSAIKNVQERKLTGGSTITQQLVKNALLTSDKTLERKLKELILATRVESTFSKDEILEMYLNEVSYGNLAYGIEEASQVYFHKSAKELTLAESALLAGLPKSPTRLSPYGVYPEEAFDRQKQILSLMADKGFISHEEKDEALSEKLTLSKNTTEIKAPHFVMYIRDQLVEEYGEAAVERGGLEVTTTLDYQIQLLAEDAVKSEVEKIKNLHVTNGAGIVLDTKTGQILAMVGSKDYWDTSIDGNVNVTLRERSPGSSIKPVTYAYALMHGLTPASTIPDTPMTIEIAGNESYTPKNYDDNFRGNISLRSALAESRNIPAVKIAAAAGVANIIKFGTDLGITTWRDPSHYGPSITLGGGSVRLIDLAGVYATIANLGEKTSATSLLKVVDHKGNVLQENTCSENCTKPRVLDGRIAFMLIDILKDNIARSPSFGMNSSLVIPRHPEVAVKTGTSNDLRDNLTIGFNQKYLTAVWVGNNDNSPMTRIASGVTGAAPIWNKIMRGLLATEESREWLAPSGLVSIPCRGRMEWFIEENRNTRDCVRLEPSSTPAASPSPNESKKQKKRPQVFEPSWQFFRERN
jgi:1A family penicillin-binding protein